MLSPQRLVFYNFKKQDIDYLDEAPTDFSDYIPQIEAAQTLYKFYQETGLAPIHAARKVLEICVGIESDEQPNP